jgi:hypothetical protein
MMEHWKISEVIMAACIVAVFCVMVILILWGLISFLGFFTILWH